VNTKPYKQMSINTAVMCVVRGSMVDMLAKCTNAYVPVNICPHAIYVTRHSLITVSGINIRLCIPGKMHIILENISIPVMFVINHSLNWV
jgi:methyl coenzyme M reductase subunit C